MSDETFTAEVRRWLKQTGRTQTWLAGRIGISPVYLSQILGGQKPLSDNVRRKVNETIGSQRQGVNHLGRFISIPVNVARGAVSKGTRDFEIAQAWKNSWILEHGEATLVRAAEEAYVRANELAQVR